MFYCHLEREDHPTLPVYPQDAGNDSTRIKLNPAFNLEFEVPHELEDGSHGVTSGGFVYWSKLEVFVPYALQFAIRPPVTQVLIRAPCSPFSGPAIVRAPGGVRVGDLVEEFKRMDIAQRNWTYQLVVGVVLGSCENCNFSHEGEN